MPRRTGATAKLEKVGHRMWLDGMTDPEIAVKVGCNKVTVWNWRYARGLGANAPRGSKRWLLAFNNRNQSMMLVISLWEKKLTDTEAAGLMGITQTAYTQRRIRLGLPNNRKRRKDRKQCKASTGTTRAERTPSS